MTIRGVCFSCTGASDALSWLCMIPSHAFVQWNGSRSIFFFFFVVVVLVVDNNTRKCSFFAQTDTVIINTIQYENNRKKRKSVAPFLLLH